MFWILKKSKFKLNFFSNIRKNNVANTDTCLTKRGYNRLPQEVPPSAYSPVTQAKSSAQVTPPKLTLTAAGGSANDDTTSLDSQFTGNWLEDADVVPIHHDTHLYDAPSDEDEFEDFTDVLNIEALTCNVCERLFSTNQNLLQHQIKKRHHGCSTCESVFQSLMELELHREEKNHWSDDEYIFDTDDEEDDEDDDDVDDVDEDDSSLFADETEEEEKEMLL